MAYEEKVADRLRRALGPQKGLIERKLFGGITFMLRGNMCCGVVGDRICLRLGNEGATKALRELHTAPMDFTGKLISTMVYLEPAGYQSGAALKKWVERAIKFSATLPAK